MSIKIKNCGLKTPATIDAAVHSGATFIGFVHAPSSPRHLELHDIGKLIDYLPHKIKSVLVTTAPDDALLDAIARHPMPNYLQVHGVTDPARLREIADRIRIPLIIAVHVSRSENIALASVFEQIGTHILFDAPNAGSGTSFDWQMLRDIIKQKKPHRPWFLAGGLTPQNVAEAIRITHAPMVDVSSGIESTRGVKSPEMIAAFNGAVLGKPTA